MKLDTNVSVDEENSLARVSLVGALNTDTAPGFEQRLQTVIEAGHQLTVLDMKELDYISWRDCGSSSRRPNRPRLTAEAWQQRTANPISTRSSKF